MFSPINLLAKIIRDVHGLSDFHFGLRYHLAARKDAA